MQQEELPRQSTSELEREEIQQMKQPRIKKTTTADGVASKRRFDSQKLEEQYDHKRTEDTKKEANELPTNPKETTEINKNSQN